jgi:hypothetical protein
MRQGIDIEYDSNLTSPELKLLSDCQYSILEMNTRIKNHCINGGQLTRDTSHTNDL